MFCKLPRFGRRLNVGDASFQRAGSQRQSAAAVSVSSRPLLPPLLGQAHEFQALVLALGG